MKPKRIISLILVTAIMLPGFISCKSYDKTAGLQALMTGISAMTLTNQQVQNYALEGVKEMDATHKIAPASSDYSKRLTRLTKNLKSVGSTPLNFKVYLTQDINAFACPDGSVRVYSGIMDLMDDQELLGIIGHEIGHVGKEHSFNAFRQSLLNSAALQAIGSINSQTSRVANGELGKLAAQLASAKFSQKQENEADDYGYDFLKQSGNNPYNMVMAFEKLLQFENGTATQQGFFQKMFSSHPETTERIARMEKRAKADGYTRPSVVKKSSSSSGAKAVTTKKSTKKK